MQTQAWFSIVRAGGIAAIAMALCYIIVAIIFFGLLSAPQDADILGRLQYYRQQHLLSATGYAIGYLLFGVLLAVLLQALERVLQYSCSIARLANSFGLIWVMLMMASGMTALIGLDQVFRLLDTDPVQAVALHHNRQLITSSLGGGIELVGGLWVLLLSIAGLLQQRLPKVLHGIGLLVGSLGILTLLHTLPYLKELFGLLQLLWFIVLGGILLRVDVE